MTSSEVTYSVRRKHLVEVLVFKYTITLVLDGHVLEAFRCRFGNFELYALQIDKFIIPHGKFYAAHWLNNHLSTILIIFQMQYGKPPNMIIINTG
jgi:hypothetical protein